MFTKEFLQEVRHKAIRKKVWFSALDSLERGILNITLTIIDNVKDSLLNIQLLRIITKLKDACKSEFIKHFEKFGVQRVKAIQIYAYSFGYKAAENLYGDLEFIRYLTFLDFNQPRGWRIIN